MSPVDGLTSTLLGDASVAEVAALPSPLYPFERALPATVVMTPVLKVIILIILLPTSAMYRRPADAYMAMSVL